MAKVQTPFWQATSRGAGPQNMYSLAMYKSSTSQKATSNFDWIRLKSGAKVRRIYETTKQLFIYLQ